MISIVTKHPHYLSKKLCDSLLRFRILRVAFLVFSTMKLRSARYNHGLVTNDIDLASCYQSFDFAVTSSLKSLGRTTVTVD